MTQDSKETDSAWRVDAPERPLADAGTTVLATKIRSPRQMLKTNAIIGAATLLAWLVIGGDTSFRALEQHWEIAVTMIFGSLVGGGTSEGGGAVAFPVLTKVLAVPPEDARLFTYAIQSVGMTAASITLLINRIPVEWAALKYGALPAMAAAASSCVWLAPIVAPSAVRLFFTSVIAALALALFVSRHQRPQRRLSITERRNQSTQGITRSDRNIIVVAAVIGGALSGVAGVGENIAMFAVLVLLFRVSEKIATPTSVILMALVSLAAFVTHICLGNFSGNVPQMWWAAVPVVAIGAPLGAFIASRLGPSHIVGVLYVLISCEVISTLLLVPIAMRAKMLGAVFCLAFLFAALLVSRMHRYDIVTYGNCESRRAP